MKTTPLLLLLAFCAPAFAANPNEKECIRLEEEISSLSARNAWAGVERKYADPGGYAELLCTNPVIVQTASESARRAGNVREQLKRLLLANKSCKDAAAGDRPCPQSFKDELASSASAILCQYAAVDPAWVLEPDRKKELEKEAKKAGAAVAALIVRPAGNFFEPDKNKVLEFANAKFWESGRFNGYLPAGEYAVDGQVKMVIPDTSKLLQVWGVQCPQ